MSSLIKAMSFNVKCGYEGQLGANGFPARKQAILDMIKMADPDIIGFQEMTYDMRLWFSEILREYTVLGCGRGDKYDGEGMSIAFKTRMFELVSMEQFWLSGTPEIPGSTNYGDCKSCYPRMVNVLKLFSNDAKETFYMYNTHLDHPQDASKTRTHSMMQIIQHISQHTEKFVLTGDMNATPDAPEIKLVENILAYRNARDCTADLPDTFHDFKGSKNCFMKIDYIFSDMKCISSYRIDDEPDVGKPFYSDHCAVCAELELGR